MSKLKPLRFGSRGKGAQRADNPVARTALGSDRLNQQMILNGRTASAAVITHAQLGHVETQPLLPRTEAMVRANEKE